MKSLYTLLFFKDKEFYWLSVMEWLFVILFITSLLDFFSGI